MAEYIERDKVIDLFDGCKWQGQICIDAVREIPAEDVAPVVHGHVVVKNRPTSYDTLHFIGTRESSEPIYTIVRKELENNPVNYCSVCGRRLCSRFENYCPNFGAKMDKEADDVR